MIGIYKITNKINGNSYIGASINIEKRWKNHLQRANDGWNKEYDKALYKAIRKYGIDNFELKILENCTPELLCEREVFWISYYDTYVHGYNSTPGGKGVSMPGEKHPNHKLTINDVIYIRELWASKTISTRELYYEFQNRIGKSGFKKIYTWQTWKNVLPELNTLENREWHAHNGKSFSNALEKNPNSRLTAEQYEDIKQRFLLGENPKNIFNDYKDKYTSYQSFYNSRIRPLLKK